MAQPNALMQLVGNNPFKESVGYMLSRQQMTHSLLLCGEAGVGVRFAARLVAAQYLYPEGGAAADAMIRGEACQVLAGKGSEKVGTIQTGIVREALIITGDGKADTIKVSQIRAMRREIVNSSLSTEGRVVLVYGAEKMQAEAANALLKILEEPPEGVLFLLTASSLAAALPTIRSRCVAFALSPPSIPQCVEACVAQRVARPLAERLSNIYGGHIGTVLAVAKTPKRQKNLEKAEQLAAAAAAHDAYTAGAMLAVYEKDKPGAVEFLSDFLAFVFAGMQQTGLSPLTGAAALHSIRAAQEAVRQISANGNTKAVLTLFAIRLGRV